MCGFPIRQEISVVKDGIKKISEEKDGEEKDGVEKKVLKCTGRNVDGTKTTIRFEGFYIVVNLDKSNVY